VSRKPAAWVESGGGGPSEWFGAQATRAVATSAAASWVLRHAWRIIGRSPGGLPAQGTG